MYNSSNAVRNQLENLPTELKNLNRWLVWRYEERDGKKTKVPYMPQSKEDILLAGGKLSKASSTNPETWSSYKECRYALPLGYDGIGFVLGDGYLGIDLDGEVSTALIKKLNSYTEFSPSGNGIHIIVKANKPAGKCRIGNFEMYDSGRFFTMTGHHVENTPLTIESRQPEINDLYEVVFGKEDEKSDISDVEPMLHSDQVILDHLKNAKNSFKFQKLWDGTWEGAYQSQSNADLALCSLIAFYTQDVNQIDRIFQNSGLYRDKWDRSDYKLGTIHKAISGLAEVYTWPTEYKDPMESVVKEVEIVKEEIEKPKKRWRVYSIKQLNELPPLEPLIEGFFNVGNWINIFGPSGSGKTFFALDTALSIVTGKPFQDKLKVKQGPILYLATEGYRGYSKRIYAWLEHYRQAYPDKFFLIIEPFNFLQKDPDALGLAERIKEYKPLAVYIDTLSLNFGPGNDKESVDMNCYINNIKPLINEFNCSIFNIHHTGWSDISHERGATNLRDVADTSISVEPHSDDPQENCFSTIKCKKQRDNDPFKEFAIEKHVVDSQYGKSCVWTRIEKNLVEDQADKDELIEFINLFPTRIEDAISVGQVMDYHWVKSKEWSRKTLNRKMEQAQRPGREPRLEMATEHVGQRAATYFRV